MYDPEEDAMMDEEAYPLRRDPYEELGRRYENVAVWWGSWEAVRRPRRFADLAYWFFDEDTITCPVDTEDIIMEAVEQAADVGAALRECGEVDWTDWLWDEVGLLDTLWDIRSL